MQKSPNDNWVRCKNCGHKLMRVVSEGGIKVETKCHSCKTVNEIIISTRSLLTTNYDEI